MNREIFVTENITKESASEIVRLMKEMEREGNYPIKFYVNCYGGDLGGLFSILDAMHTCPCELITVNIGEADSAASLIFAAGTKGKRFVTANSRVMLHEVHISTLINLEPLSSVDARVKEWRILQERYIAELARLSGKEVEEVTKDITGKDLYLSAEEAIAYGLADDIVTPKIKERYDLRKGEQTAVEGGTPDTLQENQMTKDEMIAALKGHGVDVSALSTEVQETKAALEAAKKQNEELTASKTNLEAKVAEVEKSVAAQAEQLEAAKKERVFEGLVAAGKEFAGQKETVLNTFKTAEELTAFYKDRPAVLHTQANGHGGTSESVSALTAKNIAEGYFSKEEADKYLKEDK